MADSQKFLQQIHAPRVNIVYDVETSGSDKHVSLPFTMGVLSDLSGKSNVPKVRLEECSFVAVDAENLDARMKSLQPRVVFTVPNVLTGEGEFAVDLVFERMDDFRPDRVANRLSGIKDLVNAREHLSNFLLLLEDKPHANELVTKLLNNPSLLKALAAQGQSQDTLGATQAQVDAAKAQSDTAAKVLPNDAAKARPDTAVDALPDDAAATALPDAETAALSQAKQADSSDFMDLLCQEFKAKGTSASSQLNTVIKLLSEQALVHTQLIQGDAFEVVEAIIRELDVTISRQINQVIHHADFQQLESAWRGLDYLVSNSQTNESLKIRFLNLSKSELAKSLKKFKGASWDQSPMFKLIYENEYGTAGGEPFGALIGDYYFNQTLPDVELLRSISKIAAAAHCPFIAAADPSIMNLSSWQQLSNPRDISKIFTTPEYAAWRSFRESDDSRYVALTLPRVLSRMPYGPESNPVEAFNFVEDIAASDSSSYNWMNAAYAMGVNINRSFSKYGWCASIRGVESGGVVEKLPTHSFPTDAGGVARKCPTEIAITDRREAELSKNGFLPLCYWKNTSYAVFLGGQTLNKPQEYDNPDATANAQLSARLPYIFATCRFAHYLKCIVRDKIGAFQDRYDMEHWLANWVSKYVTTDPSATDEVKAKYPLAEAKVVVEDVEGKPGYYSAKFYLRPHYQLEGLTTSLRLTTKVPSAG